MDRDDCSKFLSIVSQKDWGNEDLIASIRDRFVTGDWKKASLRNQPSKSTNGEDENDDDNVFGEFEDLETGEKHEGDHPCAGDSNERVDLEAEERRRIKLAKHARFVAQYPCIFIL